MGAEQSRTGVVTPGAGNVVPQGMSTLGPNLQKRFAKGIQYNMKVVIKGDRNVGKSCLFHRLQGRAFKEEYLATQEIQVACIQWNYKVTDDIVKVEIWDIVDKGKVKKREGLKMDTEEDMAPTLDAEFIDVYKGTSGVIMMLDITKYWTYEYVQRELRKVPLDIPVIIMASHRDMEDKRAVLTEEVHSFIAELDRPCDAAAIYYMEASMSDGFGLKYLYRFFNVPFLELQRQTLLAQLRRNEEDLEAIKVELELHEKSEEQDYDRFKEYVERKRKGLPATGVCTVPAGANEAAEFIPSSEGTDVSELNDGTAMSLRSRLSQKVLQSTPLPAKLNPIDSGGNQRIENFVPEGKLDTTFLSESRDPSPRPSPKRARAKMDEVNISDSDDEPCGNHGNPMVTMDQESPDEDDMVVIYKPQPQTPSPPPQPQPHKPQPPSDDGGYKQIMAGDDLPETTKTKGPDSLPQTRAIHMEAAPLHPINPTSIPRTIQPISDNDVITELRDVILSQPRDVISSPSDVISSPSDVISSPSDGIMVTQREKSSSITSLEDLTISESIILPLSVPSLPQIDLDILERISYAPPIAVPPEKKSPRSQRRSNPKKEVKKVPPKKSLLDIQLTSSGDDDDQGSPVFQEPEETTTDILTTFEQPEIPLPHPKRLNSSGSLKLTHTAPAPFVTEAVNVPPPTAPKKEKKKKREKTAEEIREKREQDELDEFLGGSEPREKAKKKKPKKKKAKAASSIPGADEYEQF